MQTKALKSYIVRKLRQHRGSPQVYLDVVGMAEAGFKPGEGYVRTVAEGCARITLQVQKNGTHIVSGKDVGSQRRPVIDIKSTEVFKAFEGMSAVRIVIQTNRIDILPLASETKRQDRLDKLEKSLEQGTITTAGLSFGGGVLDHSAHAGLCDAGLKAQLLFANDIDEGMLQHAALHNDVVTKTTMVIAAPMQELVQDDWAMQQLPRVNLLALGIPCSGASKAGVSKRKLAMMESHPTVGHLIASAIMVINRIQPACIVLENVEGYFESASAMILRNHLRDSGYNVQETTLAARDFGSLENRVRTFLVASTVGIDIDLSSLAPTLRKVQTVQDILDPIGPNDSDWRSFDYLKTKEVRDSEKGNGFAMQIITPASTSVPTIRRGYAKGGSTDPLLQHPTNPNLLRQLTVAEHARIKRVPVELVAECNKTDGHALLGQGVEYGTARALFERIGRCLVKWKAAGKNMAIQEIGYSLQLATG